MELNNYTRDDVRELVAFKTASQDFCIDMLAVREIRGWSKPALLPHAPEYVEGVINLRGSVVPIVDLACRLGLEKTEEKSRNVVIVTALQGKIVGLLVEAVTDILSVLKSEIKQPPDISKDDIRTVVRGLVLRDDRLLRLLETSSILNVGDEAFSVVEK